MYLQREGVSVGESSRLQGIETLGDMIDKLDNLIGATKLPMPDKFHMEQLRTALPLVSQRLKEAYQAISGSNPWAD